MNIEKWIEKNTTSLKGKVVAVTGATGDLGSNFCRQVLKLGASIVMLDRNMEKSLALKNKFLCEFKEAKIENIKLDLESMQNVKDVCGVLSKKKIDFLVLNAGVYHIPLKKGELGYNNIFQVNFVSPYYLIKNLLTALKNTKGKVVVTGSIAHRFAKFDEKDIDYSAKKTARKIYGNSKRFLMFALYELFKNEKDAKLAVAHPGVTPTQMTTHFHKSINWLVKGGMKLLFNSPERASLNLVKALFEDLDYHEWIGPRCFDIWGKPKKKKLTSCKPHECEKIFKIAENFCDVINKTNKY